jgi:hypothetical protein
MATIPAGTKFIGIDASVPTPELNGKRINDKTEHYTVEDIAAFAGVGSQGPQGVEGPAGPPGPVGPAGLEWRGAWNTNSSYAVDDAVGFNGSSWFCISAVTGTGNSNPEVATTKWALLAAQGATGPQGAQGPTGPQGLAGSAASSNYKTYRAVITQNDVNDLDIIILENTIGTVTLSQFSTGIFLIKLPVSTDLYKVFLPNNLIKGYNPGFCTLDVDYFDQYSNSDVMLRTYENINNGFVFADFILNRTPIEIIVYN